MTGWGAIAALALWERSRKQAISRDRYINLAVAFLFVAFFLIWRDQSQRIAILEGQLKNPITVTFQWTNEDPFLTLNNGDGVFWIPG